MKYFLVTSSLKGNKSFSVISAADLLGAQTKASKMIRGMITTIKEVDPIGHTSN